MQSINLLLTMAQSCLKLIVREFKSGDLGGIGVSREDWTKFTGGRQWLPADRGAMRRALEGVCFFSIDMMGLPRFQIPAEYAAAVIALFVDPVNQRSSCVFAADARPPAAADLAANEVEPEGMQSATAQQIYTLVIALTGDDARHEAAHYFEKNAKLAVAKAFPNAPRDTE